MEANINFYFVFSLLLPLLFEKTPGKKVAICNTTWCISSGVLLRSLWRIVWDSSIKYNAMGRILADLRPCVRGYPTGFTYRDLIGIRSSLRAARHPFNLCHLY